MKTFTIKKVIKDTIGYKYYYLDLEGNSNLRTPRMKNYPTPEETKIEKFFNEVDEGLASSDPKKVDAAKAKANSFSPNGICAWIEKMALTDKYDNDSAAIKHIKEVAKKYYNVDVEEGYESVFESDGGFKVVSDNPDNIIDFYQTEFNYPLGANKIKAIKINK